MSSNKENAMNRWDNDTQFEDRTIEKVEGNPTDGWTITYDDCACFGVPPGSVEPKVGSVARFYGKGFGYIVRGLLIDGVEVFYRTEAEQDAKNKADAERCKRERRERFEKNRPAMDARYDALPPIFRARIDKFRRNNPEFRWEFEEYELFCCEQAVVIADTLKTPEAVRGFHGLDWSEQKAKVPGLSDDHSGNTFGCAVRLAHEYLSKPEHVEQMHGALAPLVGSEEYGCVPPTPESTPHA